MSTPTTSSGITKRANWLDVALLVADEKLGRGGDTTRAKRIQRLWQRLGLDEEPTPKEFRLFAEGVAKWAVTSKVARKHISREIIRDLAVLSDGKKGKTGTLSASLSLEAWCGHSNPRVNFIVDRAGEASKRIQLTVGAHGWDYAEILDWIESRKPGGRDKKTAA